MRARAYDTTVNGDPTRLWYTDELPKPPRAVRLSLAALGATAATPAATAHDRDRSCDDDDEHEALVAGDFAGRVLLRSETLHQGAWKTTLETTTATRSTIAPSDFAVPSGFSVSPDAKTRPDAPASVGAPGFDEVEEAPYIYPHAAAVTFGGPQLRRPELHVVYWGETFADPAHAAAISEFDGALQAIVSADNFGPMAQYGTAAGRLASSEVVAEKPSVLVLTDFLSLFATAEFVESRMFATGPLFWWKAGPDPLIVVVVNSDEVGGKPSWGGYHLDTPAPNFLLPFPVNVFANEFMPFTLTTMTTKALELPAGGLAKRDKTVAPFIDIAYFDAATEAVSHEIYEAALDPYPFSGWSDPGKLPIWTAGEIADICEHPPFAGTRVGDYQVSTCWSNEADDCVGSYKSEVQILAPKGNLPWFPGVSVAASANALAAIDRGDQLRLDTSWQVDGRSMGTGLSVNLPGLAPGPHHLVVTVRDSNGFRATDQSVFVLEPSCVGSFGSGCGSCGGTVQCDGSCSGTPSNFGAACGSCGGTVQCDGTCGGSAPVDFGTETISNRYQAFAWPVADFQRTYAADDGYDFLGCSLSKISGGGRCVLNPTADGDQTCTVNYGNNGLEGAVCQVEVRERRNCACGVQREVQQLERFAWPVTPYSKSYAPDLGWETLTCSAQRLSGGGLCTTDALAGPAAACSAGFQNQGTEGAICAVNLFERSTCP